MSCKHAAGQGVGVEAAVVALNLGGDEALVPLHLHNAVHILARCDWRCSWDDGADDCIDCPTGVFLNHSPDSTKHAGLISCLYNALGYAGQVVVDFFYVDLDQCRNGTNQGQRAKKASPSDTACSIDGP